MSKLKELLTRDTESELIPSTIMGILLPSVQANLIMTQLLARRIGPESIPGSSIDLDLNTADNMIVELTGETAEFGKSQAAAETFNMKPVKYTVDIQISREMIEDSKFAVVEWNIEEAGYKMAQKMDNLLCQAVYTGADANGTDHITNAGSALTIAYLTTCMKFLEADNHVCTDMIVSAGIAEDLRNIDSFVEADKLGSRETFERGLVGRVYGMNVFMTNQAKGTQTTYERALIIDRRHALVLAEKRPISIERYNQVNKDVVGIAVSARFKERYLRKEACAVLYTT